ncbi:MAG: ABC transporter permease [Geminicoccaceae bacterium]|jgi:putative spermidine/putrescine transport system permease protein/spermidine/putrescine transport system permease protein|nr:MAG: ABC transporter permease [Geminicoccaceae bacterium]
MASARARAGPDEPEAAALARDARRERRRALVLAAPALLLVGAVALLPTGWLFWLSVIEGESFSAAHYLRLIQVESYRRIFWTTFEIAAVVTILAALLGYPLAYWLSRLPERWANVGLVLVLVPFWTSLLVRTYAWLVLLQRRGLVNRALLDLGLIEEPLRLVHNWTGTVIGMLHILLPFLVLPAYASLRAIDPAYLAAAASLGASPVRAFWTVFFPLSLPGLLAGCLLVFVLALGFYVTPAILGGGRVLMVAMKVQENAGLYLDWGAASALAVVLLLATLAMFALLARLVPLERLLVSRS